jgi:putative SOS response-associated peptidase YedK
MPVAPPADAPPAEEQSGILELGERAPGGLSLVVLRNPETGDRVLATMRWGLREAEDDSKPVLYVRAETIASRGPLREALRRRRCIVPMDSYVQQAGPEGAVGRYAISLADGAQIAVAAIWQDAEDGPHFAIVTCRANEAVAVIHDRMPVILPPQAWPAWLAAGLVSPFEVWDLLKPCPSNMLRIRRIPGTTRRKVTPTEVGPPEVARTPSLQR